MGKLLILGAGQYGMVAKEIAESMEVFSEITFLDDNITGAIGKLNDFGKFKNDYNVAILAIGGTVLCLELLNALERFGYKIPILIHKNAYVSPSAVIGKGSFIEPMAVVHIDVTIGTGCIISAGTIVNHNAVIGDGCHLNYGTIVGAGAIANKFTKSEYG